MKPLHITIGQKFNMLTVLKELPIAKNGRTFSCQCDCGNVKEVLMSHLIRSKIKSCGCYRVMISTKHGMNGSREYSTWENMIQRCGNPKARKYYLYGERGITVCNEWLKSFQAFYNDMGPRPHNTSIDRIDSDKGYYKENCKWSTPREQFANTKLFKQQVNHDDIVKPVHEWLNDLSINNDIFKSRILRGFGLKEALFCDIDIFVLNVTTKQQSLYNLSKFLNDTRFEKEKVLELLDCDHKDPYHDYLLRYLKGFNGWE